MQLLPRRGAFTTRTKLSILFTVLISIILLVFSSIVTIISAGWMHQTIEQKLTKEVGEVLRDFVTINTEGSIILSEHRSDGKSIQDYAHEEEIGIAIWGQNRKLLYALEATGDEVPLLPYDEIQKESQESVGFELDRNTFLFALPFTSVPYYARERILFYQHTPVGILQVIQKTTTISTFISNLWKTQFFLGLLAISITFLLSRLMAKRALAPVRNVIKQVDAIGVNDLSKRVILGGPERDDIVILAKTCNTLLERIEEGFLRQKQLFSDLSHDLKTPLAILTASVDMALTEEQTVAGKTRFEDIHDSVQRLIGLVKNIIAVSRFEERRTVVKTSTFDVSRLLQEVIQSFTPLIEEKHLTVTKELQMALEIKTDKELLEQVLHNLVDNAIKYSKEQGALRFICSNKQKIIEICIEDTGIGMSQDEQKQVFQRFYRSERSRREVPGGSGLGLSIAKQIVQQLGGSITLTSKEHVGTVVCITLPW